jgi:hypothetical protein
VRTGSGKKDPSSPLAGAEGTASPRALRIRTKALASAAIGDGEEPEELLALLKGLSGGGGVDVSAACIKQALACLSKLAKP